MMTTFMCYKCSFHTCWATTNYKNILLVFCFCNRIFVFNF